jgi:hypothetical protein
MTSQLSCPKCGEMAARGGFKGWQILAAILLFPIGLIALLLDREPTRCPECRYAWQT